MEDIVTFPSITFYYSPLKNNYVSTSGEIEIAPPINIIAASQFEAVTPRMYFYEPEEFTITYSVSSTYAAKENELELLIGKEKYNLLDDKSRELMVGIVGTLNFGVSVDIDKALGHSHMNEQK